MLCPRSLPPAPSIYKPSSSRSSFRPAAPAPKPSLEFCAFLLRTAMHIRTQMSLLAGITPSGAAPGMLIPMFRIALPKFSKSQRPTARPPSRRALGVIFSLIAEQPRILQHDSVKAQLYITLTQRPLLPLTPLLRNFPADLLALRARQESYSLRQLLHA